MSAAKVVFLFPAQGEGFPRPNTEMAQEVREDLRGPLDAKLRTMFGTIGHKQMFLNLDGQQFNCLLGEALEAAYRAGRDEAADFYETTCNCEPLVDPAED